MAITAQRAQTVPPVAGRNANNAFPSRSTRSEQFGAAGTAATQAASGTLSAAALEWARKERGLSAKTLEALGVASGTGFFPDLGRKDEAVFFRYADGWKARALSEKSFVAGGGFKLSFWNLATVLSHLLERVYLVEGELDAAALVEAGIPVNAVLSVPNGAKAKAADDPKEQAGYSFVDDALRAGLSAVKQFVWCGDSDGPGLALRADMVRLIGAARFHFVNWPEGVRDAGHMLMTDGAAALRDRVENGSQPWPVAGLYRMSDLPEPAPLTLWDPGFPEWEGKVRLAPRTLSVKTGHPGHGKTLFATQMWFQVSRDYDVPICVASFESRAKPHLRRYLRTLHGGALEKDLTWQQVAAADAWINERYLFLTHPDQRPTLAWFLDTAETAVIRHGARVVVLDPWNRLESAREPRESETDYIGRCLRELHAFAHDLNVHVQILAHPAKMEGQRRGQPPSLEDISGSKHWDNAVDQGFVVHRPEVFDGTNRKTEAVLYHRKARFDELGFPCKLGLNFDIARGRYVSTDYDAPAYPAPRQRGKDRT